MAFLGMVFKKIVRNIGLILCLLAGLVMAVALISSVPTYTGGMMEKTLSRELTQYQLDSGNYPGNYSISCYLSDDEARARADSLENQDLSPLEDERVRALFAEKIERFDQLNRYIETHTASEQILPIQAQALYRCTNPYIVEREEYAGLSILDAVYGRLQSMSDLEDHITIVDGVMPAAEPVDGVYEVLVTPGALQFFDIPLGETILLTGQVFEELPPVRVRAVGVFQPADPQDLYWTGFNLSMFRNGFLMDEGLFTRAIAQAPFSEMVQMKWYFALDYTAINNRNLDDLLGMYARDFRGLRRIAEDVSLVMPARDVIGVYTQKDKKIRTMMLPLYMSVFIMLGLYLFMVAGLIVDKERNEIALIASRGAKKSQILAVYLIEFLLLCLIAMAGGPFLGLFITKVLGASNGFLDFVNRKGIPLRLSPQVFLYGGAGMALSMLMLLIPAWAASKTNIVAYKQKKNRFMKWTLWERIFLDVILLAVAGAGYYVFKALGPLFSMMAGTPAQTNALVKLLGPMLRNVDVDAVTPFLFLVPSVFILGAGLLFVRLYPWLIRGIYRLGRSLWPPAAYHALNQVSKGFRNYHFLMIFLIMTLAAGIFSATAARTINQNDIDRTYYANGADMVISTKWEDNTVAVQGGGRATVNGEEFQYSEPSFLPFTKLPGVEHAAKVRTQDVRVRVNGNIAGTVTLMGIDPYEFSQVVWYRPNLLPYHINAYLKLLMDEPSACLVYRPAAERAGVRVGDPVEVAVDDQNSVVFTVYAFIDYWPSFNPNKTGVDPNTDAPALMVANLSYIQNNMPLSPWDVWLKLSEDAKSADIYQALKADDIPVLRMEDTRQEVIAIKNESSRLATNGILTLSFLISGVICFIGFLIFWILTMRGRVLEFGILRSMGLSTGRLIGMMVIEQVLTSLAASGAGILIGLVASKVFIPFFQIAYSTADQVPAFAVISSPDDLAKIYVFVSVILAVGLGILGWMLSRINMNQALKLGED